MSRRSPAFRHAAAWFPGAVVLAVLASPPLAAGEVPVEEAAKYLLILATSAGSEGRVACKELDMVMQLKKQAISVDAKARVAWAFTPEQTGFYAAEGKLVVCNRRKLLGAGGAIAFERINGRLTIFVHQANLSRSDAKLPEAFLRNAVKL
ncbi:MAG: hypothetical protein H6P99_1006 [Holophagaceae bacterium]|nr:hypothetical protein [Holophagaceae bacterium]